MWHSSVRAALIYQHLINGRDQALPITWMGGVDDRSKPDRGGSERSAGT
ncbi:hypothetical protein [Streptomyces sp. NPDC059649]